MVMSTVEREPRARPRLHLTAPHGWLNDPCGPGYDPITKRYHLFYQWNPHSCEWGNISWGHATSTDLVTWVQASPEPALKPDADYDKDGVFTGCFYPTGLRGEKGQLSVIYSSVYRLPIHWTLPYCRASEGIAAAVSSDGGKNWVKWQGNPVLREEPEDVDVTGWRDPYVSRSEGLDRVLGGSSLYGVVSGGLRDKGPAVFLYSIPFDDLTNWRYIGNLVDLPRNFRQSPKWSGDFGVNLECATFMNLRSAQGPGFEFLITGSEGGIERDWVTEYLTGKPETHPRRTVRYCNWLSGMLRRQPGGGGAVLDPKFSGLLDHGSLYAVNPLQDASGRRIAWGWIPEEDVPIEYCKEKGWNGCLSLPRELFLQRISHVTGALRSSMEDITSISAEQESDGTFVVHTIGIRPLPEVRRAPFGEPRTWNNISLPARNESETIEGIRSGGGPTWKLELVVDVMDHCEEAGVHIRHTADMSTGTTITFRAMEELVVVTREKSNANPMINKCDERGPFTLFTLRSGGIATREKLKMEVFCDGHVLEVFVCDRFALSTMVYTDDPGASGISLFAKGRSGSATFERVEVSDASAAAVGPPNEEN
ncbi:related to acid beta-fructofuranosidase precursor [Cephalotrichum gorgonifer]|uniref:Related to acid beta-fructofuranosidase n=1 Tax=Cephalotrichum gorgonifer TaxID=2041049 RepID=A0AAE8SXQ2_9PEZI|nr:related to acid beta-fructofuranosidase precursor [Cephalotrichum gorgonifer]